MRTESSIAKRLLKLITGISVMSLCAASPLLAAPPNTVLELTGPFTNQEYLTPVSQAGQAWTNTIPNALADYYTYIPLSNADAVAVGFPAACDVPPAGSADCYIISVREFKQPMSLDFLKYIGVPLFPGPGLLDASGNPFVVTPATGTAGAIVMPTDALAFKASNDVNGTTAWGYGSGGQNWQPYGPGTPTIRGCAPAPFQTTPFNFLFGVAPTGDQNASPGIATGAPINGTGVWHFPAPTIKGTKGRPVYVQWLNDLPDRLTPGMDPTVDCGHNALNCYPYNRHVVHVHGAHVGPESDGLATSWWTAGFAAKGEGYFPTTAYAYNAPAGKAAAIGPINYYPMDQEAGTIWYHDHAIGQTHTNTNMGMAGFFPVTDTNEITLQTGGTLPTGNFELGFALQDRHFDIGAQMIMPNYAIYDKTQPNCFLNLLPPHDMPDPTYCNRLQFVKMADSSVTGFHFVPLLGNEGLIGTTALNPAPGSGCTVNANGPYEVPNQCAPFGATSATLEYFGNMPVVNGVTYGTYPVAPGVYRMRFIGGTDSRAWIMQLQYGAGADVGTGTVIPFYQIGAEQGLLNEPKLRQYIDLMGGERVDVLVDFNVLPKDVNGDIIPTRVFLKHLGNDSPYGGDMVTNPATPLPFVNLSGAPDTEVPDIMVFDVGAGAVNYNTPNPASLGANSLRSGAHALPALVTPEYTRTIALVEITDGQGRTMPTIDARGYRPNEVPITENILINQIEQWDILNTTVDAHPMHLHQVAFQLINREAIAGVSAPTILNTGDTGYQPAAPLFPEFGYIEALTAQVYAPAQYSTIPGSTINPQPYETLAMKDTIDCPPGYVTRVLTKFDILGTYVWHCHILSHEEHDMMRPFRVVAAKLATPAYVNPPATTDANGNAYVIVAPTATAPSGPQAYQYVVQFRKVGDAFWNTSNTKVRNPVIDLKPYGPGTYEFRAQVVNQLLQGDATTNLADSNWVTSGSRTTVYSNQAVAPAYLNIASSTPTSVYLIAAPSSTPGALYDFQYSTGGAYTSFGTPTTTRNKTFTLSAPGTYTFQVIVTAPPTFTASTPRVASGNVQVASAAVAPAYLNFVKKYPGRMVYLISAPSATAGVNYQFEYSEAAAPGVWTALPASPVRNPYITLPADGTYSFRVLVTGGGFTDSLYTTMAGTVAIP